MAKADEVAVDVYKMESFKAVDGQIQRVRNTRYLWRCRDCKEQYTVRIGTVYEEIRIELRHWCYAFWRACTSKKGVSALEIKRHCQISYKSALFLMNRIRFAMAPDSNSSPIDRDRGVDETYVGGKPRSSRDKSGTWHAKDAGIRRSRARRSDSPSRGCRCDGQDVKEAIRG